MKRKSVKKGIAVALAATMTGGVLPAAAVTAAETEPDLLAEFDFNSQASDGVITGTNRNQCGSQGQWQLPDQDQNRRQYCTLSGWRSELSGSNRRRWK